LNSQINIKQLYCSFSSAQIDYALKNGAGGVIVLQMARDDYKNGCGCGVMPMLRMISDIARGEECILKKCP
jgi:hypothetical protein